MWTRNHAIIFYFKISSNLSINLKPLLSAVLTNIKKKHFYCSMVELLLNNGDSNSEVIICFGTNFKLSVL